MKIEYEVKEIKAEVRGITKPFTMKDGEVLRKIYCEIPSKKMEYGCETVEIFIRHDTEILIEKENEKDYVYIYFNQPRKRYKLISTCTE